jgi:beta-barrel assembly-enhancing protease
MHLKIKLGSIVLAGAIIGMANWQCTAVSKAGSAVGTFLMPPITEDIKMGQQVSKELESKPAEYPVLPEANNAEAYAYIRGLTNKILNSGAVEHQKDFPWVVKIIKNDKTLNAFCTPGGFIYVYTGLIKYLDSEDQLAGVMAHEIAHADKRHSMWQMMQLYGVDLLVAIGSRAASKDPNAPSQTALTIGKLASSLVGLKFSRGHETEADDSSVAYLCPTEYNAAGAAGFFEKIGNAGSPPEFMSTHPSPTNRVQNIHSQANLKKCAGTAKNVAQYQRIKTLLSQN